jgi:general secretion pathway protein B
MSLILDALKKSEAERQRQSGPTLLEVRIAAPRRRYPTWVIAVGALLVVNIGLLLAFVLRRPAATPAPGPQATTSLNSPVAPGAAGAAAAVPLAADGALMPANSSAGPGLDAPAIMPGSADALQTLPGSLPPAPAMGEAPDSPHNPADDEPALPAGSGIAGSQGTAAAHDANIPNFSEVSGDLPELRLDLHVYAAQARDRYALINMHRVREGDTLPEGPQVLAITREGVVLDYHGQEFTLRPQ